jgi:hypothetical protein
MQRFDLKVSAAIENGGRIFAFTNCHNRAQMLQAYARS